MNRSNRISRKAKDSFKVEVDRSGDEVGVTKGGRGNSGFTSYQFLPVSFTESQKGNERLFFIKNEIEFQSEESSADQQDYQFEIDNSTGNVLIVHGVQDASDKSETTIPGKSPRTIKACIPSSSPSAPLPEEQVSLLQVLDNGQCLLETTSEQITFHSAEADNFQFPVPGQLQLVLKKKAIQLRNENRKRSHQSTGSTRLKKVCQWSKLKVNNFLQCVQNHEQKFKTRKKKDFLIWAEVAKDMFALGHRDCNKDECFKKWSNLYRTWKIVNSRPKEGRRRWQIFDKITNIVRFMCQRGNDKSFTKSAKHSVKDLIELMLEQNDKHKKIIDEKLENFKAEVSRLDEERDGLIDEIGEILHKARNV